MRVLWVLISLTFLFSCGDDDAATPLTNADGIITLWLEVMENDSATRDDSGIYHYSIVENPTGSTVTAGSVIHIYYTLSDLDGNVIASHQRTDGDSLSMKQGVSAIYPVGLDIGLSFIREGETYGLVLPPNQAFEDLTTGAIDPTTIALLEVEVVNIQQESDVFAQELIDIDNYIATENLNDTINNPLNTVEQFSTGIAYKRLVKGFGPLPINGETFVVNYTGTYLNNAVFDARTGFEYTVGSNDPRSLIPGFDFGVGLMQPNEQSLIIIPSSQAYIESARVVPNFIIDDLIDDGIIPDYVARVGPYTPIIFNITRFD